MSAPNAERPPGHGRPSESSSPGMSDTHSVDAVAPGATTCEQLQVCVMACPAHRCVFQCPEGRVTS